jgi:hypothetical protein
VFLGKLSEELRSFLPKFEGADRLAETDRKIMKYDRDIARLEGRLAIPEVSVERVRERIAELRALKHEALQERAEIDQEKSQLDEVKKVLADFESFFILLDRASQLEVVHRFARRIDLGVTNIVIHWRFSENVCEVPRSEVSPETRKKGDGGRVVEIGGPDSLGVQQDVSYGLLFNLLPHLPSDAERRPSKRRKAPRGRRARV